MQQQLRESELKSSVKQLAPATKEAKLRTEALIQLKRVAHNVFADAYLMGLRNQAIHWHVKGPMFYGIHKITEENYEKLTSFIDKLAEKMRAMDIPVPTSLLEFTNLTHVQVNIQFDELSTESMIKQVLSDLETVKTRVEASIEVAERAKEPVMVDLLTDLAGIYDQEHWMLKSTLQ